MIAAKFNAERLGSYAAQSNPLNEWVLVVYFRSAGSRVAMKGSWPHGTKGSSPFLRYTTSAKNAG